MCHPRMLAELPIINADESSLEGKIDGCYANELRRNECLWQSEVLPI